MDDRSGENERRQERLEAILIAGSTLLMLIGLVLLIAAALLARQERTDRAVGSAPTIGNVGSPDLGERNSRVTRQQSDRRVLLVDRVR